VAGIGDEFQRLCAKDWHRRRLARRMRPDCQLRTRGARRYRCDRQDVAPFRRGADAARPRSSWMSPDAKRIKKLLYVSDWSSNDVYVYDFKKGTLEGQLSGLNDPYGQCVDKKGNLWVVAFGGSSVSEYARGRTQTVKTLKTDYQPMGCSVDPTTGNLAVAALHAVDVFVHARGKAHVYQSAVCYPFWAPGYDDAGNLYVEALLYGSAEPLAGYSDPLACELPHGGTSLRAGRTRAGGNPTRSLQSPPERPVGQSVSIAP
jgi:hypothetical protein